MGCYNQKYRDKNKRDLMNTILIKSILNYYLSIFVGTATIINIFLFNFQKFKNYNIS